MSSPQIPDAVTRARTIENLRQTRREIAEFNRELAEIEKQLDLEISAQKLSQLSKSRDIRLFQQHQQS